MAAFTAIELSWWLVAWNFGIAPVPRFGAYLILASAGLSLAILLRLATGLRPALASWRSAIAATLLAAAAASIFLPLKYAIPSEIPFWLDKPLALAEQSLLGAPPWLLLDRTLGWAAVPMDWLYGCWLPVQTLVFFLVVLARPSPAKTRALIAYSAGWFVLGVVAAALFASAGPIFYDRLFGGNAFASLRGTLHARGVWIATAESDRMWASFATQRPGPIAGMSAVPSIHVAISFWIYLIARTMAPRMAAPALIYFILMWIGSVQLGWHYVVDGLAGAAGMLTIWSLSCRSKMKPTIVIARHRSDLAPETDHRQGKAPEAPSGNPARRAT